MTRIRRARRDVVKLSEIMTRLNGISTPVGGVSSTPPQPDVAVVRRVLVFLEDRRVLYSPYEAEVPEHCVDSVLEIRRFVTGQLTAGGIAEDLAGPLRAMRAACRKFLDQVGASEHKHRHGLHLDVRLGGAGWVFNQALGEMRGVFGLHVAQLAVRYGLDVPEPLSTILPADDERA